MVEVICDQCERINEQTAEYCDRCGASLIESETAQADEKLPTAKSGEQRSTSVAALETTGEPGSTTTQNSIANSDDNGPAEYPQEQASEQSKQSTHDESTMEEGGIEIQKVNESHGQELVASTTAGSSIGYQLIPLSIAVVMTLTFQYYVENTFSNASFLYNLVLPPEGLLQKAIPIAIIFLFFWSLGGLALKFVIIQRQRRYLAGEAVQSCPQRVREDQLSAAHELIRDTSQKYGKSFVYRIVYSLLDHLKLTNDPQRSHEFLRHQSVLDSDAVQSSYRTIRVLIWSIAILGFVGTVVGISLAVGEFSGFLSADIEDIDAVKHELGQITTELSFAFNTALLGLTASLIAMLATSFVQRHEDGLHKDVEELCLRIISHAKVAEPDRSLEGHVENWFAELKEVLDSEASQRQTVFDDIATSLIRVGDDISGGVSTLEVSLGNIKTVFIGELEGSFRAITSDIQGVGQEIAEASEKLPTYIAKAQDTFVSELDGALGNVANRFEGVGDQISGSYANLPGTLDNVQQQFANEMKDQVEGQIDSLKNFGAAFNASVTTLSKSLTDMPVQLANAGQALEGSSAQVAQLKASIDAVADSSTDQTSAAQLLAQKVETLAISSEVTQQAVSSLQSLKSLLSELQASQAKIAPLLNQLAGPHEIRIVPTQGSGVESDG